MMKNNNIHKVTNKEAKSLAESYDNGNYVYDNSEVKERKRGKIISIESDICTIKYENGEIEKCQNSFFKDFKKLNPTN